MISRRSFTIRNSHSSRYVTLHHKQASRSNRSRRHAKIRLSIKYSPDPKPDRRIMLFIQVLAFAFFTSKVRGQGGHSEDECPPGYAPVKSTSQDGTVELLCRLCARDPPIEEGGEGRVYLNPVCRLSSNLSLDVPVPLKLTLCNRMLSARDPNLTLTVTNRSKLPRVDDHHRRT